MDFVENDAARIIVTYHHRDTGAVIPLTTNNPPFMQWRQNEDTVVTTTQGEILDGPNGVALFQFGANVLKPRKLYALFRIRVEVGPTLYWSDPNVHVFDVGRRP